MSELKPPRRKVPFLDWLLLITNITWVYGLYRLTAAPAQNAEELNAQYTLVWFGLIATVIVFFVRIYVNKKSKGSP